MNIGIINIRKVERFKYLRLLSKKILQIENIASMVNAGWRTGD